MLFHPLLADVSIHPLQWLLPFGFVQVLIFLVFRVL
jgi:hypothetical protein